MKCCFRTSKNCTDSAGIGKMFCKTLINFQSNGCHKALREAATTLWRTFPLLSWRKATYSTNCLDLSVVTPIFESAGCLPRSHGRLSAAASTKMLPWVSLRAVIYQPVTLSTQRSIIIARHGIAYHSDAAWILYMFNVLPPHSSLHLRADSRHALYRDNCRTTVRRYWQHLSADILSPWHYDKIQPSVTRQLIHPLLSCFICRGEMIRCGNWWPAWYFKRLRCVSPGDCFLQIYICLKGWGEIEVGDSGCQQQQMHWQITGLRAIWNSFSATR